MAFPPNYRQERNNRDRAKQQKAAEKLAQKLAKREDKSPQSNDEPDVQLRVSDKDQNNG